MSHSSSGSESQGFSFVFSVVFIAEEVDGVGDNRSEFTAMVDVHTLGGLYENSQICPFHGSRFFLIKSKTSGYQDFQIIRYKIKEILL
jgi:hypothetical protein